MNSTQWRDNFRQIMRNRAIAYSRHGSEWRQFMPFEDVYGNGGLLTTVGDLLKWNRNLATGALHPKVFKDDAGTQHPQGRCSAGIRLWAVPRRVRRAYRGKSRGNHRGLCRVVGALPAKRVSIALACNAGSADASKIAHQLARLFSDLPPSKDPVISNDIVSGTYRSVRDHSTIKVERSKGGLTFDGWPDQLSARSQGTRMILENPVFGDDVWERVKPWRPTDLSAFVGLYTSEEAEAHLRIVVDKDNLVLHNSPHSSFALQPVFADDFECELGSIYFLRDRAEHVVGLRLSGERVWDLRFAREKPSLSAAHRR